MPDNCFRERINHEQKLTAVFYFRNVQTKSPTLTHNLNPGPFGDNLNSSLKVRKQFGATRQCFCGGGGGGGDDGGDGGGGGGDDGSLGGDGGDVGGDGGGGGMQTNTNTTLALSLKRAISHPDFVFRAPWDC